MQNISAIKHSPITVLLIFVAAVFLIGAFLLWPTWQSISQVSRQILADRASAAAMEEQDMVVADFASKYPAYQAGIESIEDMLVDAKNPVKFFEFIEKTARLFSVQATIQLAPQADGKGAAGTFQISIRHEAFENITRFSKALENGPYVVHINKIDVKTADIISEKSFSAGVDADIIITTLSK